MAPSDTYSRPGFRTVVRPCRSPRAEGGRR
jgi:hypothetical protein